MLLSLGKLWLKKKIQCAFLRAFWLRWPRFAASNSIQHSRIQHPRARTIRNSMCAIIPLGANRNRVHSEAALEREAWSRRSMRPSLPLEKPISKERGLRLENILVSHWRWWFRNSLLHLSPSRCVVGNKKKKKNARRVNTMARPKTILDFFGIVVALWEQLPPAFPPAL